MRYPIAADGTVGKGSVLFDMTSAPGEEAIDGVEVDELGNLYVSGPGGVWILSAEGKHLGTIVAPKLPANFAWGDDDGKTLYLTARSEHAHGDGFGYEPDPVPCRTGVTRRTPPARVAAGGRCAACTAVALAESSSKLVSIASTKSCTSGNVSQSALTPK